jgi:hypothetical protein
VTHRIGPLAKGGAARAGAFGRSACLLGSNASRYAGRFMQPAVIVIAYAKSINRLQRNYSFNKME